MFHPVDHERRPRRRLELPDLTTGDVAQRRGDAAGVEDVEVAAERAGAARVTPHLGAGAPEQVDATDRRGDERSARGDRVRAEADEQLQARVEQARVEAVVLGAGRRQADPGESLIPVSPPRLAAAEGRPVREAESLHGGVVVRDLALGQPRLQAREVAWGRGETGRADATAGVTDPRPSPRSFRTARDREPVSGAGALHSPGSLADDQGPLELDLLERDRRVRIVVHERQPAGGRKHDPAADAMVAEPGRVLSGDRRLAVAAIGLDARLDRRAQPVVSPRAPRALEPAALPLPRVERQPNQPAAAPDDAVPVDLHAVGVERRDGLEHHLGIVLVAAAGHHRESVDPTLGQHLRDGSEQHRVRPDLEESARSLFDEVLDHRGEQHRLAQVAGPVGGVERPDRRARAGDRRVEAEHRLARHDVFQGRAQLVQERIHLGAVGGHVRLHHAGEHPFG